MQNTQIEIGKMYEVKMLSFDYEANPATANEKYDNEFGGPVRIIEVTVTDNGVIRAKFEIENWQDADFVEFTSDLRYVPVRFDVFGKGKCEFIPLN